MAGTAITKKERVATLKDALEKQRASMAAVLPKHLTPERMMKLALVAATKQPLLLQCTPRSFVLAVMSAAQLGIDPSGTLGSGWLVPFKTKGGEYEATLIVGYQGLIDLMRRSGHVLDVGAHVVYSKDTFDVAFGTDHYLIHHPHLPNELNGFDTERGKPVCVYSVVVLRPAKPGDDPIYHIEVMTIDEVEAVRNGSSSKNSDAWKNHWSEMARKTVVRRAAKYVPKSPELNQALSLETAADAGVSIEDIVDGGDNVIDVEGEADDDAPEAGEATSKAAGLAERVKGAGLFDRDEETDPEGDA